MGLLTGILYACLAFFGTGWYLGKWSGNFSLLLFTLISGCCTAVMTPSAPAICPMQRKAKPLVPSP